jgi:glycosyltransferase involved in cell wall biosynthesis
MMKICMAATTFPRWAGDGEGAFVWGLAQALTRQGATVCVVALHSPGASTREVIDGVEVVRPRYWWPERQESLRKGGGGLPITLRQVPLERVQLPSLLAVHSKAVATVARACDVVHAHWTISGATALITQRYHRRPILVTVQGSDVYQVPKLPLGTQFTRWVLMRAQRVTALSASLKAAVTAIGVPAERVEIIPNGVDVARFAPDPATTSREPLVLFAGYLIERKGTRYLLEAAPAILARYPGYRIAIIGKGPEEEALRCQAEQLGVAHAVIFLGFLPQDEVRQWMQRARVFVLPSLEEGQGAVLLEALAVGTPVVGSNVDGIAEVVTPDVGELFPAGDARALSAAIIRVLESDDGWQRMSSAARARAVQAYNWDVVAQRFMQKYATMVETQHAMAT